MEWMSALLFLAVILVLQAVALVLRSVLTLVRGRARPVADGDSADL